MVSVDVTSMRLPKVGDKCAMRNAQKGTIGQILPAADMPFVASTGMQPDILLNMHCYARDTLSLLWELPLAKAAALDGEIRNGTCFDPIDAEADIYKVLRDRGFDALGDEAMCDGISGERIEQSVFIGSAFYERQRHIAADKMHCRGSMGPVNRMTRQPTDGRSRNGGLRIGTMEVDALNAHGASRVIQDRMCDNSDVCEVYVCKRCGVVSHYSDAFGAAVCQHCGTTSLDTLFHESGEGDASSSLLVPVKTCHAYLLFLQELACCGVGMKHSVTQKDL